MKYDILIPILKDQVKPALGCTEPVAVALSAVRAKEILGAPVEKIHITVNSNILKNGMGVGIPGTEERGLVFAVALGLLVGKSEYGFEVFKDVKDDRVQEALALEKSGIIDVQLDPDALALLIDAQAFGDGHEARVTIKNSHTNIVHESKDGQLLLDKEIEAVQDKTKEAAQKEIKYEIQKFTVDELIDFAATRPIEDLTFIREGMEMNLTLAEVGIAKDLGMGLGKYLHSHITDLNSKAKAYTAAASEARMSGYPLPVMSSAGSGNHGLITIIPLSIMGQELGLPEEKIIRSITLSHLITIYVKSLIGSLSPVCGCGVAAGLGFASGHTFMQDGDYAQIKNAISNTIAGVTGMICDGAKLGCAYKLAISFDAAISASEMALNNIYVPLDNGILGETVEQTIQNLADVSNIGMAETDRSILDIMLNHC